MHSAKSQRVRARVLVKAWPQHSIKYEETVCVAAVAADGSEMLRLYPIRYRRLPREARFDRYDLIELEVERPRKDPRPESRHVIEDSIRIIESGSNLGDKAKVQLWRPFIARSLNALRQESRQTGRSFGIVRPDPGSLRFFVKPVEQASDDDAAASQSLMEQVSLLEDPLTPLEKPTYAFGYRFTIDGDSHACTIHDWEVQTAYFKFRDRYGDDALDRLKTIYSVDIPQRNPHFIMGTMKKRVASFIMIGILRSKFDPKELERQGDLLA